SGIEMGRLAVAVLNVETHRFNEARVRRALDRVLDDARADSAFDALAVSTGLPFGVAGAQSLTVLRPDQAGGKDEELTATVIAATPGIFRALGVPILRGRGFDDRDRASGEPVVVLSEFTARKVFGSPDAVGQQL